MTTFSLSSSKHLGIAITAASVGVLAVVHIAQFGFGLQPCQLCYYQRIPYFINIALGLAAVYTRQREVLYAAAVVFFAGAAIALFHAGVEYKWWPGLPSCSGQILPENASLDDLKRILTQQPIVRCDKAAWTLFGISMAGYNYLLSLALGAATVFFARKAA